MTPTGSIPPTGTQGYVREWLNTATYPMVEVVPITNKQDTTIYQVTKDGVRIRSDGCVLAEIRNLHTLFGTSRRQIDEAMYLSGKLPAGRLGEICSNRCKFKRITWEEIKAVQDYVKDHKQAFPNLFAIKRPESKLSNSGNNHENPIVLPDNPVSELSNSCTRENNPNPALEKPCAASELRPVKHNIQPVIAAPAPPEPVEQKNADVSLSASNDQIFQPPPPPNVPTISNEQNPNSSQKRTYSNAFTDDKTPFDLDIHIDDAEKFYAAFGRLPPQEEDFF